MDKASCKDADASKNNIIGLDFPLGVQTLLLAWSLMMMMMMMMMMESNYAVHVL